MDDSQDKAEPRRTLVGKTIAEAVEDDDGHLHLHFTDGTEAEVEGSGYDGLWTSVYVTWSAPAAPTSDARQWRCETCDVIAVPSPGHACWDAGHPHVVVGA